MIRFVIILSLIGVNIYSIKCISSLNSIKTRKTFAEIPECTCVPYYQCNGNGTLNINGDGLIDIRTLDKRRRECPVLEFCCYPHELQKNQTLIDQEHEPIPLNNLNLLKKTLNTECGARNLVSVYTSHEDLTTADKFPWSVAVFYKSLFEDSDRICSGSLIHKQVVLTTAGCVIGKDKYLTIRAGKWNPTSNESVIFQYRRADSVYIHPSYTNKSYVNDVALIKLARPVDFAENVNTVCLPDEEYFDFNNCIAPGFIKRSKGNKTKIELLGYSIMYPEVCQKILDKSALSRLFPYSDTLMCAKKSGNSDACAAELGSPLACPMRSDPRRYIQVGILIWDVLCESQDVSGILVDVVKNRKWIAQVLSSNNLSADQSGNSNPKQPRKKPLFTEYEPAPQYPTANDQNSEYKSKQTSHSNFDDLEKHYPNIYTQRFIKLALAPKFESPELNPNIQYR